MRGRTFESLIYPRFGNRPIDSIKRSNIVRLLEHIERGPHRALAVLAITSKLFDWPASRDNDFLSPIRRGMTRVKPQDYARDRVLSDDEIRAVWRAAEALSGALPAANRYTALEAAEMRRGELAGGDWFIP
jgi:integrase